MDLRPRPAPHVDEPEARRTAAGHVPLTSDERAELRRRIDDATRRRIAEARHLPIDVGDVVRLTPRRRSRRRLIEDELREALGEPARR